MKSTNKKGYAIAKTNYRKATRKFSPPELYNILNPKRMAMDIDNELNVLNPKLVEMDIINELILSQRKKGAKRPYRPERNIFGKMEETNNTRKFLQILPSTKHCETRRDLSTLQQNLFQTKGRVEGLNDYRSDFDDYEETKAEFFDEIFHDEKIVEERERKEKEEKRLRKIKPYMNLLEIFRFYMVLERKDDIGGIEEVEMYREVSFEGLKVMKLQFKDLQTQFKAETDVIIHYPFSKEELSVLYGKKDCGYDTDKIKMMYRKEEDVAACYRDMVTFGVDNIFEFFIVIRNISQSNGVNVYVNSMNRSFQGEGGNSNWRKFKDRYVKQLWIHNSKVVSVGGILNDVVFFQYAKERNHLVVCGGDKGGQKEDTLTCYDFSHNKVIHFSENLHRDTCSDIRFSSGGEKLISIGHGGKIGVWDFKNREYNYGLGNLEEEKKAGDREYDVCLEKQYQLTMQYHIINGIGASVQIHWITERANEDFCYVSDGIGRVHKIKWNDSRRRGGDLQSVSVFDIDGRIDCAVHNKYKIDEISFHQSNRSLLYCFNQNGGREKGKICLYDLGQETSIMMFPKAETKNTKYDTHFEENARLECFLPINGDRVLLGDHMKGWILQLDRRERKVQNLWNCRRHKAFEEIHELNAEGEVRKIIYDDENLLFFIKNKFIYGLDMRKLTFPIICEHFNEKPVELVYDKNRKLLVAGVGQSWKIYQDLQEIKSIDFPNRNRNFEVGACSIFDDTLICTTEQSEISDEVTIICEKNNFRYGGFSVTERMEDEEYL